MFDLVCCCNSFDFYITEIGKKGFCILPYINGSGQFGFVLQGRSHDVDDKTGHHVTFQRVISFCPGCGKKLSDLIDENKSEVVKLYELHKDLIL